MYDTAELVDQFFEQEKIRCFEGRRGVEALCKLSRALGYKDEMYFGQLTSSCSIGDLLQFLEDNSGAVEAVINWVRDNDFPEHNQALSEVVQMDDESEEVDNE